jgi:hypothetical protein
MFLCDARMESMHSIPVVLHGTLGSYFRDVGHEGIVVVVTCFVAPRLHLFPFSIIDSFHIFLWT